MQELNIPREPARRHIVLLAVSGIAMLFGWRWADQVAVTAPRTGYWLGLAATALPALAAWWSSLQLRKLRSNGHAGRMEQVYDVVRWAALLFLIVMAVLPLL